ncbi:Proliferating cell nuclear antigen [Linum perenne]
MSSLSLSFLSGALRSALTVVNPDIVSRAPGFELHYSTPWPCSLFVISPPTLSIFTNTLGGAMACELRSSRSSRSSRKVCLEVELPRILYLLRTHGEHEVVIVEVSEEEKVISFRIEGKCGAYVKLGYTYEVVSPMFQKAANEYAFKKTEYEYAMKIPCKHILGIVNPLAKLLRKPKQSDYVALRGKGYFRDECVTVTHIPKGIAFLHVTDRGIKFSVKCNSTYYTHLRALKWNPEKERTYKGNGLLIEIEVKLLFLLMPAFENSLSVTICGTVSKPLLFDFDVDGVSVQFNLLNLVKVCELCQQITDYDERRFRKEEVKFRKERRMSPSSSSPWTPLTFECSTLRRALNVINSDFGYQPPHQPLHLRSLLFSICNSSLLFGISVLIRGFMTCELNSLSSSNIGDGHMVQMSLKLVDILDLLSCHADDDTVIIEVSKEERLVTFRIEGKPEGKPGKYNWVRFRYDAEKVVLQTPEEEDEYDAIIRIPSKDIRQIIDEEDLAERVYARVMDYGIRVSTAGPYLYYPKRKALYWERQKDLTIEVGSQVLLMLGTAFENSESVTLCAKVGFPLLIVLEIGQDEFVRFYPPGPNLEVPVEEAPEWGVLVRDIHKDEDLPCDFAMFNQAESKATADGRADPEEEWEWSEEESEWPPED